jgi:hypothetical protein
MRLLLYEPYDRTAPWLAAGLARRAVPLVAVTSAELLGAKRWEHRLGRHGVELEVELADGRSIESSALQVVVNRILTVPLELLSVSWDDREYAHQELQAFWLSWLAGLPCPVLNRPTALGLSGAWLGDAEWALRASRAGLRTRRVRLDGGGNREPARPLGDDPIVLVAAGAVFGPGWAATLADECRALAVAVEADFLEVRLDPPVGASSADVCFAGATTLPDLRRGGEALLDHLAGVLQ